MSNEWGTLLLTNPNSLVLSVLTRRHLGIASYLVVLSESPA